MVYWLIYHNGWGSKKSWIAFSSDPVFNKSLYPIDTYGMLWQIRVCTDTPYVGVITRDTKNYHAIYIKHVIEHWNSTISSIIMMDKTLTPSPWTTPMDYRIGQP